MDLLTQKTGKSKIFQKSVFTVLLALVTVFACEVEEPVPTYTLTTSVTPSEGGKISVSPQEPNYVEGTQVTLTPEPNENWVFKQWEGDATGNTNPLQLTLTANKNVVGVFVKRDYPLNIKIEGEGTVGEKIVSNPGGRAYPHGTRVELNPIPKEGWVFESWVGDLTGNETPKIITVDKEKNVTVRFKRKDYSLNITITGEGTVEEKIVSNLGGRTYPFQTVVELKPVPKSGWAFEGWEGDLTGNEAPKNITVDKVKNVTVKFKELPFSIYLDTLVDPTVAAQSFAKSARVMSDRSIYFTKNNVETIISGGSQWFNNPQHLMLPMVQFKRNGDKWQFGGELNTVEMNAIRNWEFLEDGSGLVLCEHGPEWPDKEWPYGNIYLAKYSGSGLNWIKISQSKSFYHDVSAGDINDDGILDILGTHMGTRTDNFDNPHVYLGKADGTFQEMKNILPTTPSGGCCGDVEVFDINGDGLDEIIMTHGDGLNEDYVYFKYDKTSKTFSKHILFRKPVNQSISTETYDDSKIKRNAVTNNFRGYMPTGKRFADFNKDGRMDIVQERDGLTVWYNMGNGDYNSARVNSQGVQDQNQLPIFPNYNMSGYDIIDLESDGDPDLIPVILNFGNSNNLTEIDLQRMIFFNDGGTMKRLSSNKYKISKQMLGNRTPSTLQPFIRNGKLCFRGVLDMFDFPSFNNIRYLTIVTDINASYWY